MHTVYGIELDDFSANAGNGTVHDVEYFTTADGHAVFAAFDALHLEDEEFYQEKHIIRDTPSFGGFFISTSGKTGIIRY